MAPREIEVEKVADNYDDDGPIRKSVAEALHSILPSEGEILVNEGGKFVVRKVLGTLPVTADGCYIADGSEIFTPEIAWDGRLCIVRDEAILTTGWPSDPGSFEPTKCYSTREAALAAAAKEKPDGK